MIRLVSIISNLHIACFRRLMQTKKDVCNVCIKCRRGVLQNRSQLSYTNKHTLWSGSDVICGNRTNIASYCLQCGQWSGRIARWHWILFLQTYNVEHFKGFLTPNTSLVVWRASDACKNTYFRLKRIYIWMNPDAALSLVSPSNTKHRHPPYWWVQVWTTEKPYRLPTQATDYYAQFAHIYIIIYIYITANSYRCHRLKIQ